MEADFKEIEKFAQSEENSRIRAELWGDFVNWQNRWKEDESFLLPILRKHGAKSILDVALGDGVDTVFLLKNGFDVQGNEVDDAFRLKAIENTREHGFEIQHSGLDWLNLFSSYQPETYDGAICLGNSITCLFGRENQLKALKQFRQILKPGGS